MDAAVPGSKLKVRLPISYLCSLSRAIMREPVFLSAEPSYYYERSRLKNYIVRKGWKSPLSGKAITADDVIPCPDLAAEINTNFWQRFNLPGGDPCMVVDLTGPPPPETTAAIPQGPQPDNGIEPQAANRIRGADDRRGSMSDVRADGLDPQCVDNDNVARLSGSYTEAAATAAASNRTSPRGNAAAANCLHKAGPRLGRRAAEGPQDERGGDEYRHNHRTPRKKPRLQTSHMTRRHGGWETETAPAVQRGFLLAEAAMGEAAGEAGGDDAGERGDGMQATDLARTSTADRGPEAGEGGAAAAVTAASPAPAVAGIAGRHPDVVDLVPESELVRDREVVACPDAVEEDTVASAGGGASAEWLPAAGSTTLNGTVEPAVAALPPALLPALVTAAGPGPPHAAPRTDTNEGAGAVEEGVEVLGWAAGAGSSATAAKKAQIQSGAVAAAVTAATMVAADGGGGDGGGGAAPEGTGDAPSPPSAAGGDPTGLSADASCYVNMMQQQQQQLASQPPPPQQQQISKPSSHPPPSPPQQQLQRQQEMAKGWPRGQRLAARWALMQDARQTARERLRFQRATFYALPLTHSSLTACQWDSPPVAPGLEHVPGASVRKRQQRQQGQSLPNPQLPPQLPLPQQGLLQQEQQQSLPSTQHQLLLPQQLSQQPQQRLQQPQQLQKEQQRKQQQEQQGEQQADGNKQQDRPPRERVIGEAPHRQPQGQHLQGVSQVQAAEAHQQQPPQAPQAELTQPSPPPQQQEQDQQQCRAQSGMNATAGVELHCHPQAAASAPAGQPGGFRPASAAASAATFAASAAASWKTTAVVLPAAALTAAAATLQRTPAAAAAQACVQVRKHQGVPAGCKPNPKAQLQRAGLGQPFPQARVGTRQEPQPGTASEVPSSEHDLDRPAGHISAERPVARGRHLAPQPSPHCPEAQVAFLAVPLPPKSMEQVNHQMLATLAAMNTSAGSASVIAPVLGTAGAASPGPVTPPLNPPVVVRPLLLVPPQSQATAVAPPAPSAPPALLGSSGKVTSLGALERWLDRVITGLDRGVSGCHSATTVAAPETAVIMDLGGACLRARQVVKLRVGVGDGSGGGIGGGGGGAAAITIRNGRIEAAGGVLMYGGAHVTFQDVTFTAPAAETLLPESARAAVAAGQATAAAALTSRYGWGAVLIVSGAGSRAHLKNCRVETQAGGAPAAGGVTPVPVFASSGSQPSSSAYRIGCVLALEGGCVELSGRCEVLSGPCFGVAAVGPGSCARAELTAVQGVHTAGFLAAQGGEVQAVKCSATRCGGGGGADGSSSMLVTAGGGTVTGVGFAAVDGGRLVTNQCVAQLCEYSGFLAAGPNAELTSSGGCRAEENGWAGFACMDSAALRTGPACIAAANSLCGFAAYTGAVLTASERCVAQRNRGPGWCAYQSSWLVLGRQCRAVGNLDDGFAARDGSMLFAGEGCIAEGNHGAGWCALGGSQLAAGATCRAQGNGGRGFVADDGRLVLGARTQAVGNGAEGFAALEKAVVVIGPGCRAARNATDGFTAANGGRLEAVGGGCTAEGNGQHGFCSEDPGSLLLMGPGSRASGNGGWGALASGGGAEVRMCQGWGGKGNKSGTVGQEQGGRLVWVEPI